LIGEVNRDGLSSTLLAICEKCHEEFKFTSSDKVTVIRKDGTSRSTRESNIAAVMGQMATGGGFSNLEQSLSIIGVPPLSKPAFIDIERCLGHLFEQYLTELMLEAGMEERQIAIDNQKYYQGIPCITVIVDAGWSKRSHQHSYNANSGVGVIFGAATNKLLYMGLEINTVQFVLLHTKTRLTHLNTCVLRIGQDHRLQWKLTSLPPDLEYLRRCMVSGIRK